MSDPPSQSDNPTPQPHPPPQPQQQNPNPNPNLIPPAIPPYAPPPMSAAPPMSFRPMPQFSSVPNYPGAPAGVVQPPGVSSAAAQMMAYQVPPVMRPYGTPPPIPNGFSAVGGVAAPPGVPRYPPMPMVRPLFPPRPPGAPVVLPVGSRPLVPGIPNVRPVIAPLVRPVIPSVTPAEKPQTTVYVGKIQSTVEDDFMRSVLQVCGPVKNWKRAQNPNGSLRGFGFCEYETAEGLLRALRLFSKFNIDGQELMLNITEATKEYLERYVQKKSENSKNEKKDEGTVTDNDEAAAKGGEKNEPTKSSAEVSSNECDKDKKIHDLAFSAIVTDEDKEADREALEKLTSMIKERLKNKPLPPPPPPPLPVDSIEKLISDVSDKIRDGESDADKAQSGIGEDNNDDETTSDNKAASELDKLDTSSPDRSRRYDRRNRDVKREKDREIERYERETQRERIRKEREQRRKIEEAEREYEDRLKDWEYREREKEKQRQYEKEKEKEKERKRWKEILYEEEEDDDDVDSRQRWRRSALEERRRKRLREKEEDLADRIKEEEEIAEAKRRSEEEKLQKEQNDTLTVSSGHIVNGIEKLELAEEYNGENKEKVVEQDDIGSVDKNNSGGVLQNLNVDDSTVAEVDMRQNSTAPSTRKLGFGLVGSGKRAVVPSVFNEEDDDDAHKDKRMRPLVPIDYSTEEMQAVQSAVSGTQPNLVAAAEFARRISNVPGKDEKPDAERERSRHSSDRSSQRERVRDQNGENINRTKDDKEKIFEREREREHGLHKVKTPDKQKLLDAKQLIDMIPKTKDELFSYEINWAVYDKHKLHERMRPWISKKIMEFLGEEETTLVDYIVSSTQEHVQASKMLELLQAILDEEAEMFVLKMWRMLIFEIKKVETGLALRSKA